MSSKPFAILDAVYVATAKDEAGLTPPMLAEVAFAGRSNVGKSSLINMLVQRRKLVRTSSTPGATRGLSLFRASLRLDDGSKAQLDLVDLPGYGFAARSKAERASWRGMIEGYLERRVSLRLVLVLVDARRGLGDEDAQLVEYLAAIRRPTVIVLTKCDKIDKRERDTVVAALRARAAIPILATSVETREGWDELWRAIRRATFLGRVE